MRIKKEDKKPLKFHNNLVNATVDALGYIFNDGVYADKAVQAALKRDPRFGARDRKFIAETIYDVVRWKRLYNEIAETKNHFNKRNLWKLVAVWAVVHGHTLPDWKEFSKTPVRRIKGRFNELQKIRKFKESIPDWLDELGEKELGDNWNEELNALNQQARVVLRTNTLKTSAHRLQQLLIKEDIETETIKGYPDALLLTIRKNVFQTKLFKDGLFEVQDASSQKVAEFCNVKPGQRVIDACAGAGGKTLHLASLMENKGQLIAMDIYGNKLTELKRRAKRNNAHNIQTKVIESTKTIKKLKGSADVVLIDSPCSGLGVLKRNPDAKWKLQPEFIDKIKEIQAEILDKYAQMVKDGGTLVYATCSILPSENEEQVKKFLSLHNEFELVDSKSISAAKSGFDGFYMAKMKKK
jgi:16S rRNA (cytosine967-C5)-methyltransferase